MFRRGLHTTSLLCQRYSSPGGGATEEKMIGEMVRKIRERPPKVVVEILNACHVQVGLRYLSIRKSLREANPPPFWIRVLTHADMVDKQVLKYQMERASGGSPEKNPVVAVNLSEAKQTKAKQVKAIQQFMAACILWRSGQDTRSALVCGLPNAGKSSFIHALTRERVLKVRRKKEYHLASISSTAGHTLGMKKHSFDLNGLTVTLVDSPGVRSRSDFMDAQTISYFLATGSLQPGRTTMTKEIKEEVIKILRRGLERHEELAGRKDDKKLQENLAAFDQEAATGKNFPKLIKDYEKGIYGAALIEQDEWVNRNEWKMTTAGGLVMGMNPAAEAILIDGKETFK